MRKIDQIKKALDDLETLRIRLALVVDKFAPGMPAESCARLAFLHARMAQFITDANSVLSLIEEEENGRRPQHRLQR